MTHDPSNSAGKADPSFQNDELVARLQVHQVELEQQNEELRRAHAELEAARAHYVQLFQGSPAGYVLVDRHDSVVQVNERAARLLQATENQLKGDFFRRHVPAATGEELALLVGRVFREGERGECEGRLLTRKGDSLWVRLEGVPVDLGRGEPLCLLGFFDITEQRRANRRLEQFFELAPDPVCISDREGRILRASPSMLWLLGYGAEDLARQPFHSFIHPDDQELARAELDLLARGLPTDRFQVRVRTATGEYRNIVWSCKPHPDEGIIFAMGHDTTEWEAAQSRLRRSQALLSSAQRIARMGSWEFDVQNDHLHWSDETYRIFGLSTGVPLPGRDGFLDFVHPDDRGRVAGVRVKANAGESSIDMEYRIVRPDGEVRHVYERGELTRSEDGKPLRWLGMVMDVTERSQLEEQLLQSQKLESVGRLAGGVAHDFNNILTVILGALDLRLMDMPDEDPEREDLDEMRDAAERAARLTQQLLAFSRQQVTQLELLELNEVVEDLLGMLRRLTDDRIELVFRPTKGPLHVKADRTQVEQVLVNLVVNASDAMPHGGTITIALDRFEGREGPCVRLDVTDTGVGMDEATRNRVFEPFFTTKPLGEGTGLGLATVYGITEQAGGHVKVESTPDEGSTFTILLPLVEETEEQDRVEAPSTAPAPDSQPSSRAPLPVILVVEDEAALLRVARKVLERDGWAVVGAGSVEEALAALHEEGVRPQLVLTDIRLPGRSGIELVEEVRELEPGLGVILTSGFSQEVLPGPLQSDPRILFLPKPYTVKGLREAVRALAGPG